MTKQQILHLAAGLLGLASGIATAFFANTTDATIVGGAIYAVSYVFGMIDPKDPIPDITVTKQDLQDATTALRAAHAGNTTTLLTALSNVVSDVQQVVSKTAQVPSVGAGTLPAAPTPSSPLPS